MKFDKLPIHWFDLVLVAVLVMGIFRGRKRGMSEELMTVLQWVAIVVVCGTFYQPVSDVLASVSKIFSKLFSNIVAYLLLMVGVSLVFVLIKRTFGGKLIGSDAFGRGEYYLAMPAGMVRFACVLLCGLALLNARLYTPAEIAAAEAYTKDVYGSDFFPGLHTWQVNVFQESFSGRFIKSNLGFLLIKPEVPEQKEIKRREWNMP